MNIKVEQFGTEVKYFTGSCKGPNAIFCFYFLSSYIIFSKPAFMVESSTIGPTFALNVGIFKAFFKF